MKNQTLSIEQMKRLKKLGVDVRSASMYYAPIPNGAMALKASQPNPKYKYPTFTLQDILELLPKLIVKNKSFLDIRPNVIYSDLCISYMDVNTNETIITFCSDKIIDAAYKMLCWLAENGHLKGGKP